MSLDPRWREVQQVHRGLSSGADEIVRALASILASGSWREFHHPMRGLQRYETFAEYCAEQQRLSASAVADLCRLADAKCRARSVLEAISELETV